MKPLTRNDVIALEEGSFVRIGHESSWQLVVVDHGIYEDKADGHERLWWKMGVGAIVGLTSLLKLEVQGLTPEEFVALVEQEREAKCDDRRRKENCSQLN